MSPRERSGSALTTPSPLSRKQTLGRTGREGPGREFCWTAALRGLRSLRRPSVGAKSMMASMASATEKTSKATASCCAPLLCLIQWNAACNWRAMLTRGAVALSTGWGRLLQPLLANCKPSAGLQGAFQCRCRSGAGLPRTETQRQCGRRA